MEHEGASETIDPNDSSGAIICNLTYAYDVFLYWLNWLPPVFALSVIFA